jgi:putative sigma-54 modulation protein
VDVARPARIPHQELTMQPSITGHHVEVTPALRDYVLEKFRRLERHFEYITAAHVILTVEKQRQKAEATVHVSRGTLFADARHTDMYAAIDELIDKLDRQVTRHKEKLQDRHRGKSGPGHRETG